MNWKEILEFASQLSEEQLQQPCSVLIEDATYASTITSAELLNYDVWTNILDSDDSGSLEDLQDMHGDDFDESLYRLSTPAGHPFLYVDEYNR